ncbi:MAG: helix-turn-helix domain-containing protein [Clostridia bacterium]|nr:helix-turn-helix domain-containing protein [Clostridia bacterium]
MSIGTNIYALRKAKKLTQAQLAEKLGVSEQAVSKWENEQCAPDVSLFPILADYFGVSIDRLFGYHQNSYEEEVKDIIKAADDSGGTYEEIAILTEGLERFPNSPDLKTALAFSLSMVNRMSEDEAERKEAVAKAIKLCREVVDTCGDVRKVDDALNMLTRIYGEIGEFGKAKEAIERISGESYFYRVTAMARTLGYEHNDTEMMRYIEENLFDSWLAMDLNLQVLASRLHEMGKYREAVHFGKAHLKLLSVFDDGCENFYATHKFFANHLLAHAYRKLDDKAGCLEALRALATCVSHMKAVENSESFSVSTRNPAFFSHIDSEEHMEEYMSGFGAGGMLGSFDAFFGEDEKYLACKAEIVR